MIRLSRETRFALAPPSALDEGAARNGWAGWPATDLVAPQLKLQLIILGVPAVATGYLCNIKLVDQMFRQIVVEELIPEHAAGLLTTGNQILDFVWGRVQQLWPDIAPQPAPEIEQLRLHLSPFLTLSAAPQLTPTFQRDTMDTRPAPPISFITQQFEFSAAHRLHCDELTEQQNRELFGKCNNPNGHGHNYVLEVTVRQAGSSPINLRQLEAQVERLVIAPLDHKHLNKDIVQFSALNPTVENISSVIFDWLDGQFDDSQLQTVRVYETPKTWAERRAN